MVQLNVRALKAGVLYFTVVFVAGWVLGPLRELFVVPRLGPALATLLEAPIMLMVTIVAARWVTRKLAVPDTLGTRATVGIIALGLLLIAEVVGVRLVRRLSVRDYLAALEPVALGIFVLTLLLFAAMPMLISRPSSRQERVGR